MASYEWFKCACSPQHLSVCVSVCVLSCACRCAILVIGLGVRSKMIKCSVCQDRKKNRVITKCYHMFCDECVTQNLKVRLRVT